MSPESPLAPIVKKLDHIHLKTFRRKGIFTLTTYTLTLLLSRLTVFLIEQDVDIPFLGYNIVSGYHIHHYTYGILILSFVAYAAMFLEVKKHSNKMYFLLGLALGLIFDEFGIWLKLDPTYNQSVSYIASTVVGLVLVITILIENKFTSYFGEYGE